MRVLFVSNGHGEVAIAARIAAEIHKIDPRITGDHLALVGDFDHPSVLRNVGPRQTMPSGGLIAMGNVRNIARDLGAGLLPHTARQWRFLGAVRGDYAAVVAVGDVFALAMALHAGAGKTVFVGTAKSVHVASYGRVEEWLIRKADAVFVRDEATARALREHDVAAHAANVIVDLQESLDLGALSGRFSPMMGLFPGSRAGAYDDAVFLAAVVRRVAASQPGAGGVLSIAPGLDEATFRAAFQRDGWRVVPSAQPQEPFTLMDGVREIVRAWRGPLGAILACAAIVLGQAGTANEAAAAAGIPVVAFDRSGRRETWYRRRQTGLLGDALLMAPGDAAAAAAAVTSLLRDNERRSRMSRIGRERMGPPGGALMIAQEVVRACGA